MCVCLMLLLLDVFKLRVLCLYRALICLVPIYLMLEPLVTSFFGANLARVTPHISLKTYLSASSDLVTR